MTAAVQRAVSKRSQILVDGEFAFSAADFREIAGLAKSEAGIHLVESKATLVYSRLAKRLRALGIPTFSDYCATVRADDGERGRMIAAWGRRCPYLLVATCSPTFSPPLQ